MTCYIFHKLETHTQFSLTLYFTRLPRREGNETYISDSPLQKNVKLERK